MTKLLSYDSIKNIQYEKVGLICGIEIHQQLNTGKLFCNCPCEIMPNDTLNKTITRKLRFSLSETGEVDKAAMHEFKKQKEFKYLYNDKIACLVDLDEEPPHNPNNFALEMAFKVGLLLNLKFFDKVQFMRKLIINGSVTGGFQRTAMLGSFGHIKTSFGQVSVDGVNIEEDACRIISKEDKNTLFSLDRQGIPLIEITTGPHIKTPEQAYEVALQLGNILRSFKETKRGLGTIRQDLNVSIKSGARIEIKGAQNLKLIPEVVIGEIKRQLVHLSILEELKDRAISAKNFSDKNIYDITTFFKNTNSKVILSNLSESESGVFAIKLNSFKNILGTQMQENYRFATEISERNKAHFPQIKGLFHSDELPKYSITQEEVDSIRNFLKLGKEDSFILIANKKTIAQKSLKFVLEIIEELITQVPSEVRQVDPKGTLTKFLRPMPGGARMYPETDIPEIVLTKDILSKLKKELPELYDKKLERLTKQYGLEKSHIQTIFEKFNEEELEQLIKLSGKTALALYNIIFNIPKDIKKRDNIEPIDFKYTLLESLLKEVRQSNLSQQTIRDIFLSLYKDNFQEVENLKEYLDKKGFLNKETVSDKELEKILLSIIKENSGAPLGALMGHAMKQLSGKVDGKRISEMLKKLI